MIAAGMGDLAGSKTSAFAGNCAALTGGLAALQLIVQLETCVCNNTRALKTMVYYFHFKSTALPYECPGFISDTASITRAAVPYGDPNDLLQTTELCIKIPCAVSFNSAMSTCTVQKMVHSMCSIQQVRHYHGGGVV